MAFARGSRLAGLDLLEDLLDLLEALEKVLLASGDLEAGTAVARVGAPVIEVFEQDLARDAIRKGLARVRAPEVPTSKTYGKRSDYHSDPSYGLMFKRPPLS